MKSLFTKPAVLLMLTLSAVMACADVVTVTTSPSSIPADGNALTRLEATVVTDFGVPVPGVTVTWAKNPSTPLGTILDATSVTNEGGVAVSRLRSPINVGVTSVKATCGSDEGYADVTFVGPAFRGDFDAQEVTLTAGAGNQLPLVVTFLDSNDDPVADGSIVSFSSTLGSITSIGTTKGGCATALFSSESAGNAILTASCGTAQAEVSVRVAETPALVWVYASSSSIKADGMSTCLITAGLSDTLRRACGDGTVVSLATDHGTLSNTAMTSNGIVTAVLTSSLQPCEATITATYGTATDTIPVFMAGEPSAIGVFSDDLAIEANGTSCTYVYATVTDEDGRPVADGTPVTFSTSVGEIGQHALTKGGVAMATLLSAASPGTALVTATYGTLEGSGEVVFSGTASSVTVNTDLDSIAANGASTCKVSAVVRDSGGQPVADGTVVTFSTSAGTINATTTTFGGSAHSILKSATTAALATVTAECGAAQNTTDVVFAGQANAIVVSVASTDLVADGLSHTLVTANILDADLRPVADGTRVTFTTTVGALNQAGQTTATVTTLSGKAYARLIAASTPGSGSVTAAVDLVQSSPQVVSCQ